MAGQSELSASYQLGELLDSERATAHLTDVVLVCNGREFPAHKIILSATSDYFRVLFTPEWNQNGNGRVELPYIREEEMEIILPYLYKGTFLEVEDTSLLKRLLRTSQKLGIKPFFKHCFMKLCSRLSPSHFIDILNLADLYHDEGMNRIIFRYTTENFAAISKSDEFLRLKSSQLKKIISHLKINKSSVDVLIEALFRWTEVEKQREAALLDVLSTLDNGKMSSDLVMNLLRKRALVKSNYPILTMLAADGTAGKFASSLLNKGKLLCFGQDGRKKMCSVYDINKNQWLRPMNLPFRMPEYTSVVWCDGYVYFLGGYEPEIGVSSKVIKYNPTTNSVIPAGKLITPIYLTGAGQLNGSIYAVNGCNVKDQGSNKVQVYDPFTRTCEVVADTNSPHEAPFVFNYSNYLFVAGFRKGQNTVERYDCKDNVWTVITEIPKEIYWCSALMVKGTLVVGYVYPSIQFHSFDFKTKKWEPRGLNGPPFYTCEMHTTNVEGKPMLLVRGDGNVIYYYDIVTGDWVNRSKPNTQPWTRWLTCLI